MPYDDLDKWDGRRVEVGGRLQREERYSYG